MKLDVILAKACKFSQAHIEDWDANIDRETLLQCTSFQVACFLSQYTVNGDEGVEWDVVLDELVEHPMKSEKKWRKIINSLAEDLGGWKVNVVD